MNPSVLVIRGGGIGDFILTLPAIKLLRDNMPQCRVEILGYRRVLGLVDGRFYADATRSIDYGPMAACFNPRATIPEDLADYFRSFGQIISYIYDPDDLFAGTMRRLGVKHFVAGNPRVGSGDHAARQLAKPLESLALFLEDPAPKVFPAARDRQAAAALIPPSPWIAVHPGSGSSSKNWPLESWLGLIEALCGCGHAVLAVGGEADHERLHALGTRLGNRLPILRNPPLETLAAALASCALFIGHDSGISHLAAAAGAPCLLLFGPTDPSVWAPPHQHVRILRAPGARLDELPVPEVLDAILQ